MFVIIDEILFTFKTFSNKIKCRAVLQKGKYFPFWVVVTVVKCMVAARDVLVDTAEFCSVFP